MNDQCLPIVVDTGSMSVKAGFGGEQAPRELLLSAVGQTRHPGLTGPMIGCLKDDFCGQDLVDKRGLLTLSYPVVRGRVTDWEEFEKLLHDVIYCKMQVHSELHPFLFSETPDNTKKDREKFVQLAFEGINMPSLVLFNTSVLSLFATGRTTGIIIDSGAGRTHIGPVWEGYTLPHALQRIDYAGEDVTARLCSMLRMEGYPFSVESDIDQARKLKEELCYVSLDPEHDIEYCKESRSIEKLFTLPDGQQVYVNENRFLTPEVLFDPSNHSDDASVEAGFTKGWAETVRSAVAKCDPEVVRTMYANITLGGGNTLFPKLDERMQREVARNAPPGAVTKVVSFNNRKFGTWIGGSIIASLSTFPAMWLSKKEYDEAGAAAIHSKIM